MRCPSMDSSKWFGVAGEAALLWWEASLVIALRLQRLALGDAGAASEARLMVQEKIDAATQLWWRAATGQLGTTHHAVSRGALRHYRRRVGRNLRRLGPH